MEVTMAGYGYSQPFSLPPQHSTASSISTDTGLSLGETHKGGELPPEETFTE